MKISYRQVSHARKIIEHWEDQRKAVQEERKKLCLFHLSRMHYSLTHLKIPEETYYRYCIEYYKQELAGLYSWKKDESFHKDDWENNWENYWNNQVNLSRKSLFKFRELLYKKKKLSN